MGQRGRGLGHVTYFSNFGIPIISLQRLKIETSNFARRLIVTDTKQKNYQRKVWPFSCDLLFKFWDFLNISGTAEDAKKRKTRKIGSKGRGLGQVTYFSNFVTP